MKLKTPVAGAIIDVADDKAEFYISKGFKPAIEVKRTTRKRTTKKEQ